MKRSPPLAPVLVLLPAVLLAAWPRAWPRGAQAGSVTNVELKPETIEGFARYVSATEARIDRQVAHPQGFLYVDRLGASRRSDVARQLKQGEVFMDRLETDDAQGNAIEAPGGMIHHWIGDVFVPSVSLGQVIEFLQDYNHHQDYYQPEIVRSRLIRRENNDFSIFYRLRKHKIITVTLNTEHAASYSRLDDAHSYSRSVSTRIAEVADADKPDEHEKPLGRDGGFLWRINSYWRFVERDGGVMVECESISLTRDIPTGLGWLIGPFVTGIPKESLDHTLDNTRSGVLARAHAGHPE